MAVKREMRRKDRMVDERKAKEIIQNCDFGVLITADLENNPYGVAVSHVLEEDKIYFHCAGEGRKTDNLRANPKVAMTFVSGYQVEGETYTVRYESAMAEGTAVLVTDEEEKLHAMRLICLRYTDYSLEEIDAYVLPKMQFTAIWRIDTVLLTGKVNEKKN